MKNFQHQSFRTPTYPYQHKPRHKAIISAGLRAGSILVIHDFYRFEHHEYVFSKTQTFFKTTVTYEDLYCRWKNPKRVDEFKMDGWKLGSSISKIVKKGKILGYELLSPNRFIEEYLAASPRL